MNSKTQARIFKIESLNTHNGPGYRTVVYFKGCPLKCKWCHNPESISLNKEIWIINNKCIGCESCIQICPVGALSMSSRGVEVNRELCVGCQICADVCPAKAIEKIGDDYTVEGLFERIINDKPFWDSSNGGVTLTGGEPGIHTEFVKSFVRKCKQEHIHVAFDTSGYISIELLDEILPHIDMIFFDLKIWDEQKAEYFTGQGTRKIQAALKFIKRYIEIHGYPELQFRTPIIPNATDFEANLKAFAEMLEHDYAGVYSKWELCMFNNICEDKYQKLDKNWAFKGMRITNNDVKRVKMYLKDCNPKRIEFSGLVDTVKD